jgi:EmrB/QacA subfamily drug resistance transporter
MPATLSIITNVFTDPRERGRAIGVWAGVSGIGVGLGPVTGGFLLQHFWWGAVLLVNVPIVIFGLIAGFFFVPNSKDPSAPKLDPVGAVLSIVGLSTLLWGVIEGPSRGWGSTDVLGAFGFGVIVLVAFMLWELNYSSPMLDIHFFDNPRFSAASGSITLTFMALFGSIFLLTQYLQIVLGFSPLKAGAVLLPMSAVMMVCAPLSARVVERVGTKMVVGSGLSIVAIGLLLQTRFTADSSMTTVILVTMVLGLGMANIMAPATESIMGSLPRAKAGVGSAVNDTTRQVGGAVGVALLGSLMATKYLSEVKSGLNLSALPPAARGSVTSNLTHAIATSKTLPASVGAQVEAVAKNAFMSGMHLAVFVAACIMIVAAVGVFLWLPARAPEVGEPVVVVDDADLTGQAATGVSEPVRAS